MVGRGGVGRGVGVSGGWLLGVGGWWWVVVVAG